MFLKTFLTVFLFNFVLADENSANPFGDGRIINGDRVDIEMVPYYVSIALLSKEAIPTFRFKCGGGIISPKWILTAAREFLKKLKFIELILFSF